MNEQRPTWDEFFLGLADYVSTRSKDPSTKVGAVIVRPDKTIASLGYNGFPRWMDDNEEWLVNREEKYSRVIHGEMNAILNTRESLGGCTLYSSVLPCDRCMVHIGQAGITRIVSPKPTEEQNSRWAASFDKSRSFAKSMGVILVEIDWKKS